MKLNLKHGANVTDKRQLHHLTFDLIWREFYQPLHGFLIKHVKCTDTAQDILQEVFIKVHQQLPSLKNEERLAPWLYQICRTTMIDSIRKQKSSILNTQSSNDNLIKSSIEHLNYGDRVVEAELFNNHSDELAKISHCIAIILNDLPEEQQTLLYDRELNGLKQQQVADKYSLSLTATKSRLARGRVILKRKLSQCCTFEFTEQGISHDCKMQCGCELRG